jgi:hypothetical protein
MAQDITMAAYPELTPLRPSFLIAERESEVRIVVREIVDPLAKDSAHALRELITATVGFDTDGAWKSFVGSGPLVKSEAYEALRARVRLRPFQSAREAQAWLESRGAKYGPDRGAPLDFGLSGAAWNRVLGVVTIQPGGFQWTERASLGQPSDAMPGWLASASRVLPSGASVSYQVLFEPFTGRIIRMVRE